MLIGAVRGGHVEIVRALLNKYADIDVRGQVGAPFSLSKHKGEASLCSQDCYFLVKSTFIHGLGLNKCVIAL